MHLKKDRMGRTEIVGSGELRRRPPRHEVGFILDRGLDVGTFSAPVATRYTVTVYQQRARRIGGARFWERATEFEERTAEEATKKAQDYIASQKWQYQPGGATG